MTIPVPLSFELPEGWRPIPTQTDNVFAAIHPSSANGFTANLAVSEQDRTDSATLPDIADESVHRLEAVGHNVSVQHRSQFGSPNAPGLTQIINLSKNSLELAQCQFLMSLTDPNNPARRVVVEIALTATTAQLPDLVDDFEKFVSTIRPES